MHNPSLPYLLPVARNLPVQIVWGREDKMVPIGALEPLRRALKNTQVTVFDGCGHRPEVERTAEFVQAVDSFLE
jgi:pimeloyl-ACP methyl ester carboxylesterase